VQEVSQLLLLQVLLGQVLEVSLGERELGVHDDLGLISGDGDLGAELTGLAVHLDSVVEELLERSGVQNLILHRGGKIDGELSDVLLAGLLYGGFLEGTEKYIQNTYLDGCTNEKLEERLNVTLLARSA
jgi:hypothetical protein